MTLSWSRRRNILRRISRYRKTVRTEILAARHIQFAPRTFPPRDTCHAKVGDVAFHLAVRKQRLPDLGTAMYPVSTMQDHQARILTRRNVRNGSRPVRAYTQTLSRCNIRKATDIVYRASTVSRVGLKPFPSPTWKRQPLPQPSFLHG